MVGGAKDEHPLTKRGNTEWSALIVGEINYRINGSCSAHVRGVHLLIGMCPTSSTV